MVKLDNTINCFPMQSQDDLKELENFIQFNSKWVDKKEEIRNKIYSDPNLMIKLFGALCYIWVSGCLWLVKYIYKRKGLIK